MSRKRTAQGYRRARVGLPLFATLFIPATGLAQLRPYDPFAWSIFDGEETLEVELGGGLLWDQRAALAGTEGRLLEAGNLRATFRSGRIAIEAAGTVLRSFREQARFAEPDSDVEPADGERRLDSGDYRIATTVGLTSPDAPRAAAIQFGTRLPTTNNRVGLERDRIDFFSLLLGRIRESDFRATVAVGLGIHGTRSNDFEQSDVLIYQAGVELVRGSLWSIDVVGHADGLADRTIRGNEELAELRVGVRIPGRISVHLEGVRGLTAFSPEAGIRFSIGTGW
jgi:hypothetical protein